MSRQEYLNAQRPGRIETAATSQDTIITRREIGPLLLKAQQVIRAYEKAAACGTIILDQNDQLIENDQHRDTLSFCPLYQQHFQHSGGGSIHPCIRLHREGLAETRRRGNVYVYMCELGLIYWISPIYSNGRYAGAIGAGGVLSAELSATEALHQTSEKLCALSGGGLTLEQAKRLLAAVPKKTHEEVKALARLLRLCADQVSGGTEDYGETVKRIIERESGLNTQIRLMKKLTPLDSEPVYPLDKERMLLAALRRGDHETGQNILHELLEVVLVSNPGNFDFIRLRAIELVVLLSRAAVTPDSTEDEIILETASRCLKRIQESKSFEELTGNLQLVVERLAGQIFSFKGIRHASALRRAERYIWENYTRKISLQEAADVSGLSAPYFSTIFKEEMGENFSSYINRLRVEKAISMMTETSQSLNQIAAACGFEDQSWFSKIFKAHTGMSPGKYRDTGSVMDKKAEDKETQHAAANS